MSVMKTQIYSGLNNIKLCIIGKPNSGKSTLFNSLLNEYLSPVGDEYGLTKNIITNQFQFKDYNFNILDTPGLRRKNKVTEKDEQSRNSEVIKLVNKVDVILLLIDSLENITKQDFRLADICINKNKLIFFIFNKIDLIEDKKEFKNKIGTYLKNNYNKSRIINLDFVSAKKYTNINLVLKKIIHKKKLLNTEIQKNNLNKFLIFLIKESKLPKIRNIEIKPKYIVQLKDSVPTFKVFINSKSKAPEIFRKYFDNAFRKFFKLDGIPIIYKFMSSKNPYSR